MFDLSEVMTTEQIQTIPITLNITAITKHESPLDMEEIYDYH